MNNSNIMGKHPSGAGTKRHRKIDKNMYFQISVWK